MRSDECPQEGGRSKSRLLLFDGSGFVRLKAWHYKGNSVERHGIQKESPVLAGKGLEAQLRRMEQGPPHPCDGERPFLGESVALILLKSSSWDGEENKSKQVTATQACLSVECVYHSAAPLY